MIGVCKLSKEIAGVSTISILGDFNEDQVKQQNSKIADVLVKYDMVQLFNYPNHFTETSSLVIYLYHNRHCRKAKFSP
jgi:hypothetical protein